MVSDSREAQASNSGILPPAVYTQHMTASLCCRNCTSVNFPAHHLYVSEQPIRFLFCTNRRWRHFMIAAELPVFVYISIESGVVLVMDLEFARTSNYAIHLNTKCGYLYFRLF